MTAFEQSMLFERFNCCSHHNERDIISPLCVLHKKNHCSNRNDHEEIINFHFSFIFQFLGTKAKLKYEMTERVKKVPRYENSRS